MHTQVVQPHCLQNFSLNMHLHPLINIISSGRCEVKGFFSTQE